MGILRDNQGKFINGNERPDKWIKITHDKCIGQIRDKETRKRMSNNMLGKKHPNATGPLNHNWKGGVLSSIDKLRKTTQWYEWRDKVYKRDNYTCQLCSNKDVYLNPHHIFKKHKYLDLVFDINNGITLCKECHLTINHHEDEWFGYFLNVIENYRGDDLLA